MMTLLLAGALILISIVGLVWMARIFFSGSFTLLRGFWQSRSGLNPQHASGRWRLLGSVLVALCLLMAGEWVGYRTIEPVMVWLGWMNPDENFGMAGRFVLLLAGIAVGYAGFRCLGRAKRYEVTSADQLLAGDDRSPVLYLRSFTEDARVARHIGVAGFSLSTEETEIADIFRSVGPLVAIGRPGEAIGWAGAARKYVGNEDWQACVHDLMQQARLVILRAGATSGLWWEIAESVQYVKPERLIFLIPLRRAGYEEFRGKAEKYLPCRLPDYQGWRNPVIAFRSLLYFDPDWTPHLQPISETTGQYMVRAFADLLTGNISWHRTESKARVVLDQTFQPILVRLAKDAASPGSLATSSTQSATIKRDAHGRFQKMR